jgi:hypothetical protein
VCLHTTKRITTLSTERQQVALSAHRIKTDIAGQREVSSWAFRREYSPENSVWTPALLLDGNRASGSQADGSEHGRNS